MKIVHIVGARPNFMKVAPVFRALAQYPQVDQKLVHTGQHYDFNMSDVFFQQLGLGAPDFNLQVGSGSHAQQTAEIMLRFEPLLLDLNPDLVLVYGDVNSTVAAALVCSKLRVRIGHVEAGLRSFDRSMPEEINRLLTDQLSDLLFTPSQDGNLNLKREGVGEEKIHLVGNVMIDTLVRMLPAAERQPLPDLPRKFALVTLHRPANVDDPEWLGEMLDSLQALGKELDVVFPVHPRTRQQIEKLGQNGSANRGLRFMDPLPYVTFLALQRRAAVVITDSGGIQEETTYLGTPCLTVRENTERPVTVQLGTNVLVGRDPERLRAGVEAILRGDWKTGQLPPLWDGRAAERIAGIVMQGEAAGDSVSASVRDISRSARV
jgi:UDP-N-acetylglucosamine 2-epimerase (non-hydrolysing)